MVPKKYGEGVADNEAMPYVTGMLSKVGMPFTILASTDTALNRCWPHWRVEWRMPSYLFLPNILFARRFPFIFRELQGLSVWFPHAPRYRQSDDGRVVYQENFDTVTDETRF